MADLTEGKTFRMDEETYERLEALDNFSETFRAMAELYLDEPFFQNGVDAYNSGKVDSFEDYAEAYFEASAKEISTDIVERLESSVEPEEIVEPLRDYLAAVNFGDRQWAEQTANEFYDIDEALGDLFTSYTQRFSQSQWDDTLE